ncbi:glycine-rich domain-containing protein [Neoroseomonas alkaliterrae]|uniref:glycine-rich domain-containing protein n=1 Tax=Neoroseomonas alkaliterrae TaxID=1452450 RepID=UPI001BA67EE7|nr:hypothetical protein [Neoroseomonas alkaliterrae]
MQRVTRSTAAAVLPAAPASPGTPGYFTGGDPVSNVPATVPGYEWFNGVQEELIGVIIRAGLAPDQADLAQLRKSLDRLFGGGLRTVAANVTLSPDDAGVVLVDAATASRTITLPAANAANGRPLRFTFVRVDAAGANSVVLARAGADTIEGLTQIGLGVGRRLTMVSDGASAWRVTAANDPRGEMQVFTSSGTFTVPAGVSRVRVTCTGGGGAGAGTTPNGGGGGGAAGQTAIGWYDVTPGSAITVTVGAGGAAGAGDGGAGGTSSFGAYCSAPGGAGGTSATGAGGHSASAATGGQVNLFGGDGGDGTSSAGAGTMGGAGGASYWGGGGRMATISGGGGLAGRAPGSGGGGAYAAGVAGSANGGAGAAGIVIVEW